MGRAKPAGSRKEGMTVKLFIKGKMFDSIDTVTVTGENGEELYLLKRDTSGDGHKIALSTAVGVKIADIEQRGKGGKASFAVLMDGEEAAVVERKSSIRPHYTVKGPGWDVTGSIFSTKYKVTGNGRTIADLKVSLLKSEIDIADSENPVFATAVVMAIRFALYLSSVTGAAVTAGTIHP